MEDGDATVRLIAGVSDEFHAVLTHPLVRGLKLVDAKEKPYATDELLAYCSVLSFAICLREQKRRRAVGRPDLNPPLAPTVVCDCRRIIEEFESKLLDEEFDGCVVVVHDDGDLLDIHDVAQAITW